MTQIEPNLLWLGHAGDCRDVDRLVDAGIEAVVQVAIEEPPAPLPREIIFVRIPLYDGSGNSPDALRFAVKSVEHFLASKVPALVCCSGGMSRSPAVAAIALARLSNRSPIEMLEEKRSRHPTDVSPALWHDLMSV